MDLFEINFWLVVLYLGWKLHAVKEHRNLHWYAAFFGQGSERFLLFWWNHFMSQVMPANKKIQIVNLQGCQSIHIKYTKRAQPNKPYCNNSSLNYLCLQRESGDSSVPWWGERALQREHWRCNSCPAMRLAVAEDVVWVLSVWWFLVLLGFLVNMNEF